MTLRKNFFIVSKIKKIKIYEGKVKYLVKWYKSSQDTWEPIENFPDDIETYPGYHKSLNYLLRVKKKKEKDAIQILSRSLKL